MKKSIKFILIATLLIVVYSFLKRKPLDKIEFSENINDVVSPVERVANYRADFGLCQKGLKIEIPSKSGSSKLFINDKTETDCIAQTIFESQGGFFTNDCLIPLSTGTVVFNGENFEEISNYCQINSTGTGLLELN